MNALLQGAVAATAAAAMLALAPEPARAQGSRDLTVSRTVKFERPQTTIDLLLKGHFTAQRDSDAEIVRANVEVDLTDFQAKLGTLLNAAMASLQPGCNGPAEFAVDLGSVTQLTIRPRPPAALFSIGADFSISQCIRTKDAANSKVDWKIKDLGYGIQTRVPVVVSQGRIKRLDDKFVLHVNYVLSVTDARRLQISRSEISMGTASPQSMSGYGAPLRSQGEAIANFVGGELQAIADLSRIIGAFYGDVIPPDIKIGNPQFDRSGTGRLIATLTLEARMTKAKVDELYEKLGRNR